MFGSGSGIGFVGDVKTNTENIIAPTIAMICIFLSTKRESLEILLITLKI